MQQKNNRPFQAIALSSAILSQLAGSTLIGIFVGRWLDGKWSSNPLFLIIGIFIGLAAGVYGVLTTLRHYYSGDK
ncbi:AtpZ/AtpI family protein [Bacillus sp. B15-48]|uniref:AtpZ/AtpI family protein n=1 Tax=Bacillus sp. B15-48 TaxID=1548601 RepID=UPI0019401F89|nr:AtpZ/AtpI family protein [Bacillus sp. B15-48]MBM4761537.1 hypothetical protein [Bacillus sp. B15-48]